MSDLMLILSQNLNATILNLSDQKINDSHNVFKELEKFTNLQELDISNNELTYLPQSLAFLKNLKTLDITNNLLNNFEKVSQALETLPNLTNLKVNLSTQEEALSILNKLPHLEFLNGKSTKDDEIHYVDIEENELEDISFNKEEMEKFSKMFAKLSEKQKSLSKDPEKKTKEAYENLRFKEIEKIKSIEESVPNYVYAAQILRSKMKIVNFLHEKFIEYNDKKDPEGTIMLKEIYSSIAASQISLFYILDKLYPKITEKTNLLKSQLDNALKATGGVDNSIQTLEDKVRLTLKEKDTIVKQYQDEREILMIRISKLEEENKLMTEKILKRTKDLVNETMNAGKASHDISSISNFNDPLLVKSKSNISALPNINNKIITKKLMKDTIEQLYEAKANFDKKCYDNKMPKETMEQYMYTYLNHKYGIKSLIVDWASTIINGIKQYSSEDNDICVFGKILRNECEEKFRHVMNNVKGTIVDLLTYYLRGKFPLKSIGDIKEMVNQRTSSWLAEEEWREIIFYMYVENDAKYLYDKLMDLIKRKYIDTKPPIDYKKLTREEIKNVSQIKDEYKIPFCDFQKVILDFQLKTHDKFLKNFIILFKKIDSDNNGIINEEEFINLISSLNLYKEEFEAEVSRMLGVIDPFNKQQITFSDLVTLLDSEQIIVDDGEGNERSMSILERISMDEALIKQGV